VLLPVALERRPEFFLILHPSSDFHNRTFPPERQQGTEKCKKASIESIDGSGVAVYVVKRPAIR
jgi:hypothetical protein